MKKSLSLIIAALLVALLTVGVAHDSQAALTAVGPLNAITGVPDWYQDTNGLQLQLCTDPINCITTPIIPGVAFSQALGFGDEMFYFIADAQVTVGPQVAGGDTDLARFRLALELAFTGATAPMAPGEQIVFTRINLQAIRPRVPGLCSAATPAGCPLAPNTTYTVTHPYGTFTFTTDAIGSTNIVRSEDLGGCIAAGFPCNFAAFLPTPATNFGPFLTAVAPPPPPGFIGNPALLQTVTGSPLGTNFFRIDGPNAGGPGIDTVQTTDFNLAGQPFGLIPRFQDVQPIHPFFAQINAIATAGITGGCSVTPPLFCPDAPVSRAQMAVFLGSSRGTVVAPPCAGNVFTDVNPLTVGPAICGYIEKLAADGITGGCSPGIFCPNAPVTRAQMAVFIEAALGVAAPPACSNIQFGDVNATVMSPAVCGFIEDFATKGITGGCQAGPPPLFCPNNPVTRGEMAVFLVAAPPPLLP